MPETRDCGADAAAYVLGALEPAEVDRFRRHLQTCTICQDEVASLQPLADALPLAAPQYQAPASVRRNLMADVRADARAHAKAAKRAPRTQTRRTSQWASRLPAGRLALAPALCVVIAACVFVGVQLGSTSSTHVYAASLGDAQVRLSGGHAELIVHRLPDPGSNHIYEVWLKHGSGAPQPTKALFSVTSSGDGDVDVPGNIKAGTTVMVTKEPAGGTSKPTTEPVIITTL
jgi:anti-sigma-K factor RskA